MSYDILCVIVTNLNVVDNLVDVFELMIVEMTLIELFMLVSEHNIHTLMKKVLIDHHQWILGRAVVSTVSSGFCLQSTSQSPPAR